MLLIKLIILTLSAFLALFVAVGGIFLWQKSTKIQRGWSVIACLILWLSAWWIKDFPLYQPGNCFMVLNKQLTPAGEAWHKPLEIRDVEYQVLKVGKHNYLVHSSIPNLGDYPIIGDVLVKSSDCKIIFKEP